MHEYLVYGHGVSWYAEKTFCCCDADAIFLSGCERDTDSYRRLRQWYFFSVLSGCVVLPSDLAEMRENPKAKQLQRPGSDCPLEQALMAPLEKYP